MEEPLSLVQRLRQLATDEPDTAALHAPGLDGSESRSRVAELDRRSSQVAGAMAAKGVGVGDRVALGLRNSPELVLSAFAGVEGWAPRPFPVRWDLPDWELDQLREVIDARLHLGDDDLAWIRATADAEVPDLPDVLSPRMMGICSSGSTGTPKIIVSAAAGRLQRGLQHADDGAVAPGGAPAGGARAGADVPRQRVRHPPQPAGRRSARRARAFDAARRSTRSSAIGSRASRPRRRCSSASPTCRASTTAICRASSGSCRARRRCRRPWCIGGRR